MLVKQAKAVARQWVMEEGSQTPGFYGAFYHGSTNWLPEDAILPATSDLDVMLVLTDPNPAHKPGKFIYRDVMLEVSYLSSAELLSPELILSRSHMAGSFRTPGIILDPTGRLTELQVLVAKQYAKRQWVEQRCLNVRNKILSNLQQMNAAAPFHDQVTPWLFAAGLTTHILLVAGLKNPTVRRRYVAVRELLAAYGHADFYEPLLALLGGVEMSQAQVAQHLGALSAVFDTAKTVIKTSFFFAADISDLARPVAIDGSRELIEGGYQREAIFWMVATYSRCQQVLYQDGTVTMQEQFKPGYQQLLADLGITGFADLQRRSEQIKHFLPRVWTVAEAIMDANPDIEA